MNLYLVTDGKATACDIGTPFDATESILVIASSEVEAIEIACAYDKGYIGIGNVTYQGRTIAAATGYAP